MSDPPTVELTLRDGSVVRVSAVRRKVTLESPGRWKLTLSRREAWELGEALDAVATSGLGRPPHER